MFGHHSAETMELLKHLAVSNMFTVQHHMRMKSQSPKFGIRKSLSPLQGGALEWLGTRLGFKAGMSGHE